MQTRRFTHLPSLTFAVLCTILVGSVGADASTLVGTWLNEVNVVTCPPEPEVLPPPPEPEVLPPEPEPEDGGLGLCLLIICL